MMPVFWGCTHLATIVLLAIVLPEKAAVNSAKEMLGKYNQIAQQMIFIIDWNK